MIRRLIILLLIVGCLFAQEETKNNYKKHYKENIFLEKVNKMIGEILDD